MEFKWINCKDRLPNEIKQYLVRLTNDIIEIDLRTPCSEEANDISYAFRHYTTKQWAELPKPYYPNCDSKYLHDNPWVCGTSGMLESYYRDKGDGYYLTCDRFGYMNLVVLKESSSRLHEKIYDYVYRGVAIMFVEKV